MLAMRGELVSKKHVVKQSAFLVLSMRARLLAIPGEHAHDLLNVSDEREMSRRLDAIIRSTLDDLAEWPLKVSDPDWMQRLDDESDGNGSELPAKRPKRATTRPGDRAV